MREGISRIGDEKRDIQGTDRGQTGDRLGTDWGQTGDRLGTDWGPTGDQLGTNWGPVPRALPELKSAANVYCFSPCHLPAYVTHFPGPNCCKSAN
jgi:hypothetical protein